MYSACVSVSSVLGLVLVSHTALGRAEEEYQIGMAGNAFCWQQCWGMWHLQ